MATKIDIVIEVLNRAQGEIQRIASEISQLGRSGQDSTSVFARLKGAIDENSSSANAFKLEVAGIVGGLALAVKSAVDAGAELSHFSERTGISVTQLSALARGARQYGVSQDELNISLRNFERVVS